MMLLSDLAVGQKAKITQFETSTHALICFLEIGLFINANIQILGHLVLGGNLIILSDHGKYILRKPIAKCIKITTC